MIVDLIERNKKSLEDMQAGDIIFFHPVKKSFFASLILLVTGQYYHHGAIVVDKDTVIEADPVQGVHTNDLAPYMDQHILDLYRFKTENSEGIVQAAQKYIGWSYDYGNVLWAGFGFLWLRLTGLSIFRKLKNPNDENHAVNSEEYIDLVFKDCGIDLRPDIPSSNITAQNIADSKLLIKLTNV